MIEYIIGVFVSLLVEVIKKYFGTSKLGTLLAVFIVSIIGGIVYYNVSMDAKLFSSIKEVLLIASAFYAIIIRQLKEKGFVYEKNNKNIT